MAEMYSLKLASSLRERFGNEYRAGEPMSEHTTFKVGGPADFFVEPSSAQGVADAVKLANECEIPWLVKGKGSNLLVADEGVNALVIELGPRFSRIGIDGTTLRAQAGATNGEVAQAALEHSLTGYEYACGIPGSIGGAAIMNAGAYGGEFKDVCRSVTCLDREGRIVEVNAEEARWGYRESMMADEGYVVLAATIELQHGDETQIRATMDDLARRREEKQPLEMPSAGSAFKRPAGHYAGQLIEEAGMRGHTVGGAQVSEKHCGFIVNTGTATAKDVMGVIRDVQDAVKSTSGVELEPEIKMWGFDQ